MKVLVIYDSFFGNTKQIALKIAETLGTECIAVSANDFKPEMLQGVELLVVGSPTRAFRPTPAMIKLLKELPPNALKGIRAAAFDTRACLEEVNSRFLTVMVSLFGYAAEPMAKQLRVKGADLVLDPAGFRVTGKEGPLKDGELERAMQWLLKLL